MPFSNTEAIVPKPFKINEKNKPETVGDHIRAKRIQLGLFQKDLAKDLGVSVDTVTYWETNRTVPYIKQMPKIIRFLGYNPIKVNTTEFGGKIYLFRILNGLTSIGLGRLLNVHSTTVESWERNETLPKSKTLNMINKLIVSRIP